MFPAALANRPQDKQRVGAIEDPHPGWQQPVGITLIMAILP